MYLAVDPAQEYEAVQQLRKGQVQGTTKDNILSQMLFVSPVLELAA